MHADYLDDISIAYIYIIYVYQNNKTITYNNIVIVNALIRTESRLGMTYQNLCILFE